MRLSNITSLTAGDYIYTYSHHNDSDIHFIGIIKSIHDGNVEITGPHYFTVSHMNEMKAFLYNDFNETMLSDATVYHMTKDEWTTTYINFIKNDGVCSNDLPEDLIANNTII